MRCTHCQRDTTVVVTPVVDLFGQDLSCPPCFLGGKTPDADLLRGYAVIAVENGVERRKRPGPDALAAVQAVLPVAPDVRSDPVRFAPMSPPPAPSDPAPEPHS